MVDLSKLILHTGYNSFKNISVQRDQLVMPATLNTSSTYSNSVQFALSENASFLQAYKYTTDYGDYFNYLDSSYHDHWRQINTNNDDLLITSDGLYFYNILMSLSQNVVTFTLFAPKATLGTPSIQHPTGTVPVTFVEYRLAN